MEEEGEARIEGAVDVMAVVDDGDHNNQNNGDEPDDHDALDDGSALLAATVSSRSSQKSIPALSAEEVAKLVLRRSAVLDDVRQSFAVGRSLHGPKVYENYRFLVKEVLAKSSGPAKDLLFEMAEQGQPGTSKAGGSPHRQRPQSAPGQRINNNNNNNNNNSVEPDIVAERQQEIEGILTMHLDRASSVPADEDLGNTIRSQQLRSSHGSSASTF